MNPVKKKHSAAIEQLFGGYDNVKLVYGAVPGSYPKNFPVKRPRFR